MILPLLSSVYHAGARKSEVLRRNLLLVRNAVTWIANALRDGDDYRRLAKEIEPLNKLPPGASISDENADEVIATLAHAVSDACQIVTRFLALKKPTRLQESLTEELSAYFDFVAGNSLTRVPQNEPFVKPSGWDPLRIRLPLASTVTPKSWNVLGCSVHLIYRQPFKKGVLLFSESDASVTHT